MPSETPADRVAQRIADLCDHDPPERAEDPHPKLFTDLDNDRLSDALFDLWQKGILYAQWDEDNQETAWRLSHFGDELCERGLTRPYIEALEAEIEIDSTPDAMEVLEP